MEIEVLYRLIVGKDSKWLEGNRPYPIPRIGEYVQTKRGRKRVVEVVHSLLGEQEPGDAVSRNQTFQTEVILED